MARAKVQGNDAASMTDVERLVEFWHNDDQGIPLDDAAAEVLASLTSVVPRADAEKLATALEDAERASSIDRPKEAEKIMRAALAEFRAAHPREEPKCPRCNDTGWCCAGQPDAHRCRCGAVPREEKK